jgi:hypothetical protein
VVQLIHKFGGEEKARCGVMPSSLFAYVFGQITRGVDRWVEQYRFAMPLGC